MANDLSNAKLDLSRNFEEIRALFPVTEAQTYLMNAAQSPLNTRSRAALDSYLHLSSVDLDARPSVREPIRDLLAGLLGGNAHDYAITTSTGTGISTVAAGFAWQDGDNVVLPAGEHWNSTFPWLNLQDRGVTTRTVQPNAGNRVLVEDVAQQVDNRTRVISVTAVRFDTGFRADLRALADLAHSHNALLVVDGTQCAGASKINVVEDGIDVLACGGFKWLMGLAGTGFMYANKHAQELISPVSPGMFAAEHRFTELNFHDDARRYETGTIAYALLHGWAAGLQLLTEIGIENIAARNFHLTDRLIAGLKNTKHRVLSPVETQQERSAILAFTTGSNATNQTLFKKFEAAKVKVSHRHGSLRVSPNFFNTEVEIDDFLNCL